MYTVYTTKTDMTFLIGKRWRLILSVKNPIKKFSIYPVKYDYTETKLREFSLRHVHCHGGSICLFQADQNKEITAFSKDLKLRKTLKFH